MPKHHNVGAATASRRRRASGSEPLQKMTFQLSADVARAIREAVEAGEAPSANVFVEDAVRGRLRARRQARVYAAYANAAGDPAFIEELRALDRSFDAALGDGAR